MLLCSIEKNLQIKFILGPIFITIFSKKNKINKRKDFLMWSADLNTSKG